MDGNKMTKFLLLLIAVDLLLFSSTEGWFRRRSYRRRHCSSSRPSGVAWKNNWHGSLYFKCQASTPIDTFIKNHYTTIFSINLVPRAFPFIFFLREKPWGRGCLSVTLPSCKGSTHSRLPHVIQIPRSVCHNF